MPPPYCELFQPLTVDYDLIEVSKGVCWSLKKGKFVEDAIEEHQIGSVTKSILPVQSNLDYPDSLGPR